MTTPKKEPVAAKESPSQDDSTVPNNTGMSSNTTTSNNNKRDETPTKAEELPGASRAPGQPPSWHYPYPPPPPHEYHHRRGGPSRSGGEDHVALYPPYPHHPHYAHYAQQQPHINNSTAEAGSMQPPPRYHHPSYNTTHHPQQHPSRSKTSAAASAVGSPSNSSTAQAMTEEKSNTHPGAAETATDNAAAANTNNDSSSFLEQENMEEDTGADYPGLEGPVGSFADMSPPRHHHHPHSHHHHPPRRSPPSAMKQVGDDGSKRPQRSPPASVYPYGAGYPHHHSAPPASYYTKSPRSGGPPPHHHYPGMYPPYPAATGPPHSAKGRRPHDQQQQHPSSAPPPHHYPYPPHGYPRYYPHHYPQQHPGDPWTSPQAYETEVFAAVKDEITDSSSNIKEAFRASPPQASPRRHGASSSVRMEDADAEGGDDDDAATTTTPEKIVKTRSPFRSPPVSQTKSLLFRSPGLGGYGSFGMMDTPGGTLAAEFSPMGPMLANPFASGFGEHPTPPQLSLSRSDSDDGVDMPDPTKYDEAEEGVSALQMVNSPFSGFMADHFPSSAKKSCSGAGTGGLQGVSRSPLRSERRAGSDPRADRPPMQHLTSTQPDDNRRPKVQGTTIMASPLGHASTAKPRKLWHGPTEQAPMRLELGSDSSMKKSLDGINTMMRSQTAPVATPVTRSYGHPPPPISNYRRLNTPIKGLDPSPMHSKAMGPTTGNKRSMQSSTKSARDGKVPRSGGKENATTPSSKRSPCNCKKSKCLKLYCECFAAELFCQGCNCTDCHNTDEFADIRDKAMKDTRAKNPNAFKPRFSVKGMAGAVAVGSTPGHNMGCRCKRSECLKKYCECFQAGVMCGNKCKCVECSNFAGSQKLIDKRRKIKDQRGAELAMKVAEQTWKGPQHQQHSARKLPVARPAVHGMRPMPSPVATPGGRMPMAMHMMHPSPSGHPYMRQMLMGPPHGHMGYSPMGMHPHVSPSAYGMYPPPHHHPPPTPNMMSTRRTSPSASATKRAVASKSTIDNMEMPYTRTVSTVKATPMRKPSNMDSPMSTVKLDASAEKPSPMVIREATNITSPLAADERQATETPKDDQSSDKLVVPGAKPPVHPTPKDRPDPFSIQPTPAETKKQGPAEITPMPATPAPAVRLAYDPSTQKKRKVSGGSQDDNESDEASVVVNFGSKCTKLPKRTAGTVFSFLSKSELQRSAAPVCREWNSLAEEEALRQSSSSS